MQNSEIFSFFFFHTQASAVWSENVTSAGFRACALIAGRHFFNDYPSPSLNWLAYQITHRSNDAGRKVDEGVVMLKTWYTGSLCHYIKPKVGFFMLFDFIGTKIYVIGYQCLYKR